MPNMSIPFYIVDYDLREEGFLSTRKFRLLENDTLEAPAILLVLLQGEEQRATLCQVRRAPERTANAKVVHATAIVDVYIDTKAIARSSLGKASDLTGRKLHRIPNQKRGSFVNYIIKGNPYLTEDYFDLNRKVMRSDAEIQLTNALYTGIVGIFGLMDQRIRNRIEQTDYLNLRESQIIDLDWLHFPGAESVGRTPDGKAYFKQGNRLLYIHKTDRLKIEEVLGVDFVYYYQDEQRAVFVQYNCPNQPKGKYSCDQRDRAQLGRMFSFPDIDRCQNINISLNHARLCRCPVFVKLCMRNIRAGRSVPDSSYYPVCIWREAISHNSPVSCATSPHLTNEQFYGLVRGGFIGSTEKQARAIEGFCYTAQRRERMRLVFEETAKISS